jgi:hypothetical protein
MPLVACGEPSSFFVLGGARQMSRFVERQTGSLIARFVNGGERIKIMIITRFEEGNTSSGPYSTAGSRSLKTEDGRHVDWESKGRYKIIDHDGKKYDLESDDPNAP